MVESANSFSQIIPYFTPCVVDLCFFFSGSPTLGSHSEQAPGFRTSGEQPDKNWGLQKQTKVPDELLWPVVKSEPTKISSSIFFFYPLSYSLSTNSHGNLSIFIWDEERQLKPRPLFNNKKRRLGALGKGRIETFSEWLQFLSGRRDEKLYRRRHGGWGFQRLEQSKAQNITSSTNNRRGKQTCVCVAFHLNFSKSCFDRSYFYPYGRRFKCGTGTSFKNAHITKQKQNNLCSNVRPTICVGPVIDHIKKLK